MGCFLACFGSSKDRKRRKRGHKFQPRDQRNAGFKSVQSAVSLAEKNPEKSTNSVSEIPNNKPVEQPNLSPRKKVTFDSMVTTYEHVSVVESTEFSVEKENEGKLKEKEENLVKPSQSQSCSEDGSITSSSGSYPSNHRYQNCRDSDDELDYGESDIDDDYDDEDEDEDEGMLDFDDGDLESVPRESVAKGALPFTEEVDCSVMRNSLPEKEVMPNPKARDRSGYVHSVLNPVENLTQWKAVKAKGTPPLKQQKENHTLGQEPRISFSSEPSFGEVSFSFKAKSEQPKKSNQEIAVDASLSNWLGSSESTPINKLPRATGLDTISPEKSTIAIGSNSPKSFDDRPILGALTMEELKQFSASSSPRKSPSRSPDEMPIIGTVGTYWNHNVSGKDSGSVSSFKGIPNTTSKYSEDRRVNWHSTPFETRLERALNAGAASETC